LWAILVLALLGLTAAALWRGPTRNLAGATPAGRMAPAPETGSIAGLQDFGALPEFAMVSQTGDSVQSSDLRGTVWVADFIFTHCASTCPMMTAQLARLEKSLAGEPVRLVSFSVDPERDTPERLAEYAAQYGATPDRWLFLTGNKGDVRRLAIEGFRLSVTDPTPEEIAQGAEAVLHSTRLVLVDTKGHVRGYYDGTRDETVNALGNDARRLLAGTTP
jgi:cytochrome oxidase Cu insertion factor (SCO1/SenC/PrrC family)